MRSVFLRRPVVVELLHQGGKLKVTFFVQWKTDDQRNVEVFV